MLQDIRSWQKSEGNLSSIVRYAKSSSALDPTTPEQWFRLAAEMAHQIKSRQEREIYLFMDCPGTIALMAAESLGTWSGKNIHLMQYLRVFERTHAEEAYTEFFHILS